MVFKDMILCCTELGIIWANEMNFGLKHAPDAGLIVRPVDLQSSVLPLRYGYPYLKAKVTFYLSCDYMRLS